MSLRRDQRVHRAKTNAACRRKRGYPDEATALAFAVHQVSRGAPRLKVYRCPRCGRYHLAKKRRGKS